MQKQNRRVQKLLLYDNAAEKYTKPAPVETGRALTYDISEQLIHPEKLTKWYQEQDREAAAQTSQKMNVGQKQHDDAMQKWLQYKTKLGGR